MEETDNTQKMKKTRPAMQIYRPPGIRGAKSVSPDEKSETVTKTDETSVTKPTATAGVKPSQTRATSEAVKPNPTSTPPTTTRPSSAPQTTTDANNNAKEEAAVVKKANEDKPKSPPDQALRVPNIDTKKKANTEIDWNELSEALLQLDVADKAAVETHIKGRSSDATSAESAARTLVQYVVETMPTGAAKQVSRYIAQLFNIGTAGGAFHKELITSLWQYYECRDTLRQQHFRYWLSFINFISDIYASVGFTYEGDLVTIILQLYNYMLRQPDALKIEELECLIASLLSVGYDLERQCPEALAVLRENIRDAFVNCHEPWARKMLLLMVELSASGWRLPEQANQFYFHTHSTQNTAG